MPAKGKHRRPKTQRFTRSIAVAGTGGAALALPLMGATGAHAAPAQSASEKAVQSLPATEKQAAEQKVDARLYTVKAGDYLAKIAEEQHVSGGWKKLYADNREAVGDDPSLIHPGLRLTVVMQATANSPETSSAPKSSAPSKPSAKTSESSSKASKSPAKATAPKTTTQSAGTTSTSSGYTLPVEGATVGTPYHMAGSMWSSGYHTGVDFVVPTGTSLKAVAAGTVVSAGWGGAYGNQVVIKLNDGYYAQYAHLSSISVSTGQSVTEGQEIGLSGATGNVTGPHLHFEIRTTPDYGSDVDPVAYLRSHGVSVG
ncbi:LysM peptidoglycan-binding domain-containing M23 family metallopeptidase [Streptomyces sp. S.PNR 29]|uniref:M23 family metallopeptidase n=1 Tax=Streptomyces sp. S.PNR 29 TaxID=2973805 RepID=UPI0025B15071|nr:LysM peptidoglycan-binding domain-containing M23 family metallopeptidase [Streptomyces sp. S.PNR 29]MDN0200172.1 LysM peptidoglycan-binding domain-containing M23 family metallopeptidase [Streptomyces sp. S.PNR 29]